VVAGSARTGGVSGSIAGNFGSRSTVTDGVSDAGGAVNIGKVVSCAVISNSHVGALHVYGYSGFVQRSVDTSGISFSSIALISIELADLVPPTEHGLGQEVACSNFRRNECVRMTVERFG